MLFKTPFKLDIVLDNENLTQTDMLTKIEKTPQLPVYRIEDLIQGHLDIKLLNNKNPVKHQGIKIHLEGNINIPTLRITHCFVHRAFQLAEEGILEKDVTIPFSFDNFPRMLESCTGFYGEVKYVVRAVIHRSILSDITEEKEIVIHLNQRPLANPRIFRLVVTCGGEPRLEYHQNKHEYLFTDCIIGKIIVEPNQAKLTNLSFSLIRKENCLLIPKLNMLQSHEDVLDTVNLTSELNKIDHAEGGTIPFRLFLSKYDLQSTSRHQTLTALFSISYVLKIRFQEENGKRWIKEVKVGIWRNP